MCSTTHVPAAQYLRMSTEHQQYSLENQSAAIQRYANSHGFWIVQTYSDAAKSGLVLRRRSGLQKLLQDVVSGHSAYKAVLVYDVSRWGRFQDTDEAAHYEFLCKRAGIPVVYCAETFVNDGSMPNMIMKALKRVMAGEYSRELSEKVFAGKKTVAQLGFRSGGTAGYGLRRLLISPEGKPKQILQPGERKCLVTDRVKLVRGPSSEVKCVREIYRMAIDDKMSIRQIVSELNGRGIKFCRRPWTFACVSDVLKNPKYAGLNVWGRTTQKLGGSRVRVPVPQWVRVQAAHEALVDEKTFAAASAALHSRTWFRSDEELLDGLRRLLATTGRLSQTIINNSRKAPSATAYRHRFGSLSRSYELIGYCGTKKFSPAALRGRMQRLRNALLVELLELFAENLTILQNHRNNRPNLEFRNGPRFCVLACHSDTTALGGIRWVVQPVSTECHLITLSCRCNAENTSFKDFYVFPNIEDPGRRRIKENDSWLMAGKRLKRLAELRDVASLMVKKGAAL